MAAKAKDNIQVAEMRDLRAVLLEQIAKKKCQCTFAKHWIWNRCYWPSRTFCDGLVMSHECPLKGKRPVHGASREAMARWGSQKFPTNNYATWNKRKLCSRGPFLERPGKLTGPVSYFEIEVSRKVGCVLTSNEVHFISLAENVAV